MDFKTRMRQLAGTEKTKAPAIIEKARPVKFSSEPKKNKRKSFENSFINEMISDKTLENYIQNNEVLKRLNPYKGINEMVSGGGVSVNNSEIIKNKDFFAQIKIVSDKSLNKTTSKEKFSHYFNKVNEREIDNDIRKFEENSKRLNEAPPMDAGADTPPPDMGGGAPTSGDMGKMGGAPMGGGMGSLQGQQQTPQLQPPADPTAPQPPSPEQKASVKKSQLVANVVKAVGKLSDYIDWTAEPEVKVQKLIGKLKRGMGNEDPKKNNLASLSILLSSLDKLPQDIQDTIRNNYTQYIANNDGIMNFIDAVSKGEKAEGQPEEGEIATGEEQPQGQEQVPAPEELPAQQPSAEGEEVATAEPQGGKQ